MDEQQRVARAIEGRMAQKLTMSEAVDLLELDGGSPTDIKHGLELADAPNPDADIPAEMEEVDPGWTGFQDRQVDDAAAPWEVAADATGEAALAKALHTYGTSFDDGEILAAALNVATVDADRYSELLGTIARDDPDEAAVIAQAVSNTLAEYGATIGEIEFQEQYAASQQANVAHAAESLQALAEVRQMSPTDVERAAAAYREVTGIPLRSALTSVMPEERAAFLQEVAVAAEVDEKAESMRAFRASFFAPDTDISSGLVINGVRAGGELPPAVMDPAYNAYLVEQQVRRADAERVVTPKPGDDSADAIKYQLLDTPEERDWREGLTTTSGRPTSYQEIAERDPDSLTNQQARQRERAAAKIANLTGGRRV